jgi:biofilm PGA synthesis protein PgaD
MKYDSRLIIKPHAQPTLQRTAWGMVTAACWALYVYLLAPLLTVILWLSGFHTARFELYQREHAVEPFVLMILPLLALACILLLTAWAEYNRWRFAKRQERRSPQANVGTHEIARSLGASQRLANEVLQAKNVILHMDEDARPSSLTKLLPAMPATKASEDTAPKRAELQYG